LYSHVRPEETAAIVYCFLKKMALLGQNLGPVFLIPQALIPVNQGFPALALRPLFATPRAAMRVFFLRVLKA